MSNVKIGKARYEGKKRKYWKLKDGESVFRILPPLFSLAEQGRWSIFYSVHYGYKNSKGQARAFQSPLVKNRKNGMVEAPDAALERIQTVKTRIEQAKKAGNKEMVSKLMELAGGPKSQFNCDSHHYVNAMDEQGNIGVLKIRHRAKLSLDAEIKKLREKGVDPLSVDNGRFFVFTRSGMARETVYQASVYQKTLNIEGVGEVKQDVVHKLTPEVIERLGEEAADLAKLFKRPTSEEVERIVKEGASAVDDILDAKSEELSVDGDDYDQELDSDETAATEAANVASAASVSPVVTPTTPDTVSLAAATNKLSVVAPSLTVTAPVAEAPKTTAQVISDMSVEDFLKTLES